MITRFFGEEKKGRKNHKIPPFASKTFLLHSRVKFLVIKCSRLVQVWVTLKLILNRFHLVLGTNRSVFFRAFEKDDLQQLEQVFTCDLQAGGRQTDRPKERGGVRTDRH